MPVTMPSALLAVVFLCLLLSQARSETNDASADDPVRVMSFNIRLGVARDGENDWQHRQQHVVATVKQFGADLVGTQETYPFQAEYLQQQLPEYEYFGRCRNAEDKDDEQCGILYRRDRFEKLDGGHYWLSPTPETPGSKGWDAAITRMVTWLKLRDRTTAGEFYFLNTHFDHVGRQARDQSAQLLRQRLPKSDCILVGDFNEGEGSVPYRRLCHPESVSENEDSTLSTSLVDSYRALHPEREADEGTFNGFRGRRQGPRIDWILVRGAFTVLEADIDRTQFAEKFASDHFAVTAVLRQNTK